jgi:hypothetical protein
MKTNRAVVACSVGLIMLTALAFTESPLSGQRGWHQGNTWLKWSQEAREIYVFAYLEGYAAGAGGCCGEKAKAWADSDQVVKSITDFYSRYPGDREIYIHEVMEQLGKGLTLEQIHNYLFSRHRPAADTP